MRTVLLLLRKDLLVLRRSPLLLGVLLAYPLVIAALVGLVASYANAKPRVALVDEDGLPAQLEVGGRTFDVEATIDRVANEVTLVRLEREEAERQLASGRIVALLVVPRGFVGDPQVLLLDEPTASLDPAQRERLWERLRGVRERGGAVCFATQNLEEVERAGRVLRIDDGRLAPA